MKRQCIIKPKNAVNAASAGRFNRAAAIRLMTSLKEAYNQLDAMGHDTYAAVDGEKMQEDLDIYIRQIDTMLRKE